MLRKYKTSKQGVRRYNSCDNSKLQEARDRVAAGKSQRSVCAELNTPWSTLYNKLKKKHTQKPGRPTVLNEEEELSIAEHLLATEVFINHLQEMLYGGEEEASAPQRKRRRLKVAPGKSIQGNNVNQNLDTHTSLFFHQLLPGRLFFPLQSR